MSSLITAPARILIADPPWRPGDSLPGPKRGAAAHYPTMTVDQIARFPLPPLERDAILFLWRLACMQDEALLVARMWGFTVKSELVWIKQTVKGKRHFGMGRYVRAEHEVCLIATRGRYKVDSRKVRSTFTAKVPVGPDGKARHSAKPDEFYGVVRELCGAAPAVELFARQERPGFLCYGNELALAAP